LNSDDEERKNEKLLMARFLRGRKEMWTKKKKKKKNKKQKEPIPENHKQQTNKTRKRDKITNKITNRHPSPQPGPKNKKRQTPHTKNYTSPPIVAFPSGSPRKNKIAPNPTPKGSHGQ